ncbi:hypothetical protein ACJMK2_020907 [Sinanodonta woodiana]|uniref:Protein kinase C and casein kinase substrate in neurons protein 1 n=1 Tax=Sinanodonta woodiana TaxID=1069815 RepID=A0ABD3U0H5_SINWO
MDETVQASSDSFWELGKYSRSVARCDNGYKLCSSLRQMIDQRNEVERNYAKQLTAWSKKWNDFLDKGPEYASCENMWRGVLSEADRTAALHTEVAEKLMSTVHASIKTWQKENYHKSMMHFKETKEFEDGFRKAQKPWEKKYTKVLATRKEYHTACRQEKSTANQENNARGDSSFSPDQLKKLQEKLKKCQLDVEATNDKYQAALNDLNSYNPKYIEDMNEVFYKCQDFERKRIDFFKKVMFDIHQCLDLSVEPRFSQIYQDLHTTISNCDSDSDLRWWSANHGADMAMNWPTFEEYSPELQAISKKSKPQISSGDGITITSIKHREDVHPTSLPRAASSTSRDSSNSHSNPALQAENNNHRATPRQESYDPSLNPFGEIDDEDGENNENDRTNPPASIGSSQGNPFGDVSDEESQNNPEGARFKPCQVRALYDYAKDEDDELQFNVGDVFLKLTEEDELGWCKGEKDGVQGLFPANYVENI